MPTQVHHATGSSVTIEIMATGRRSVTKGSHRAHMLIECEFALHELSVCLVACLVPPSMPCPRQVVLGKLSRPGRWAGLWAGWCSSRGGTWHRDDVVRGGLMQIMQLAPFPAFHQSAIWKQAHTWLTVALSMHVCCAWQGLGLPACVWSFQPGWQLASQFCLDTFLTNL